MRRLVPLLLLAAPALCWAADTDDSPAPKRGACVYVRPANAAPGHEAPQALPAIPAVSRGAPKAARGNGGDAETTPAPRARTPHWHSFLPGMFR
ncbi:hypothetical protein [Pseudoxanthomonas koreensis]|uniref:hypothetical protein n=1 Tax=Pseudoxanthomonas koreensis TaxID=266061 RepID=UPI0035A67A0E